MSPASLLWVALGGAIGSVLRAVAGWMVPYAGFPLATLAINVVGSALIGALMARLAAVPDARLQAFAVAGICGGFTTFSTFSWQTFERMQRGEWGVAAANVVLSVALCLAGTWIGWRLAK